MRLPRRRRYPRLPSSAACSPSGRRGESRRCPRPSACPPAIIWPPRSRPAYPGRRRGWPRRCRSWHLRLPGPTAIPPAPGQPDLSSAVAFSQIVGPGGFRRSDRLRLGLTLIAPGTHYPPHAHPAIETYLVIAGTALLASRRGGRRGAAARGADPSPRRGGPCHADRRGAASGNLVLAGRCDLALGLSLMLPADILSSTES